MELSGFATTEVKGLMLRNGESRPGRRSRLGLANVAENVTVVGMSPLLQTTNASVSQTISQKQIEDLPVAGRSLLSFASLSAGVTPQSFNRGTQFGAAGSSRSQYVTVEGGRDSSTNYAIDGVYVPLAAIQQPVAEPAARRGAGSERAAELVHHRVRPGAGRRFDRDQVRFEPVQAAPPTTTCVTRAPSRPTTSVRNRAIARRLAPPAAGR